MIRTIFLPRIIPLRFPLIFYFPARRKESISSSDFSADVSAVTRSFEKEDIRYVRIHRIRNSIFFLPASPSFLFSYLSFLLSRFSNISSFARTTRVSFWYVANVAAKSTALPTKCYIYLHSLLRARLHTLLEVSACITNVSQLKKIPGKALQTIKNVTLQRPRKAPSGCVNTHSGGYSRSTNNDALNRFAPMIIIIIIIIKAVFRFSSHCRSVCLRTFFVARIRDSGSTRLWQSPRAESSQLRDSN